MAFAAGTAVLDRVQHVLTLDRSVHVMRHEQVIETDHAVGRLSTDDDVVQFVELRGNARVEGGGAGIDALSARDIDLDYTDDGSQLEAVALTGGAAAALTGGGGTQQIVGESVKAAFTASGAKALVVAGGAVITMIGENGQEGRRIGGDHVELDVAADGTLTRAAARDNVRLDLPPSATTPPRTIRARRLDGTGAAGRGLTSATFTGDVTFTEASGTEGSARTARAQRLETLLASDAVTEATFTGDATFEEAGLKACAARMQYQPAKGSLALTAAPSTANPVIAEEQVTIEALTVDVALETRRVTGKGSVRTQMGSSGRCRPSTSRPASERRTMRMPGLLEEGTTATITAQTLDYQGDTGEAVYMGRAVLTQADTAIHADTIRINQASGDLTATGNAISTMTLDGESSQGRAHEIRYEDEARRITYAGRPAGGAPAAPVTPGPAGRGRGPAAAGEPELAAPLGHLRAGRIDIVLAAEEGRAEQVTARTNVRMNQTGRTVTGGATFSYEPKDEQYVINGDGATPVTVVERQGASCREFSGRSLTFYKSNDRIVIDGQNRSRTQIAPGTCPAPAR
jgi:lipopolysaccharide export system protein LptA